MYKTLQNCDWNEIKNLSMVKLHEKYSNYVLKIVHFYYFYYKEIAIVGYEDLPSIASIILIQAWQSYDFKKAISFKSYLRLYCKNSIRVYFKKHCWNPDELSNSRRVLEDFANDNNISHYDPSKNYQIKENLKIIKKSLKLLKEPELKVIKMALSGYSISKMSKLFNMKYEAVFYVLKKFRKMLKKFGFIEIFS